MELKKALDKQAAKLNACADGRKSLAALTDKHEMVQLYLKHIDFCLMNDYPSNEFIRENFVGVMEKYGVHLNETFTSKDEKKIVALGGSCAGVSYGDYSCGELFIKNNSVANIIARDHAFVMVDAFDDAVIHVYAYDRARVCVNVYGNANVDVIEQAADAHTRIINKNKKTY